MNLPPDGRVYYLLFASRAGGYVSDSAMTEIATRFLDAIHATPWLGVSPPEGVVPAGESRTLSLQLDASSLAEGVHQGLVTIETNDLIAPRIEVPVSLTVGAAVPVGLRITPRTIERHGRGHWVTACVFLPPSLMARDVVRTSVRLNGVAAANAGGQEHEGGSIGLGAAQAIDDDPEIEGGRGEGGRGDDDDDHGHDHGRGHDDDPRTWRRRRPPRPRPRRR